MQRAVLTLLLAATTALCGPVVVSGAFTGKTRVQQHQMVYQALEGRMGGELHALALQTSAPKDN